jgi:reactive intermediate/imine deaminase
MPQVRKVVVPGVGRLAAFSHATVVGGQVLVSGILGTVGDSLDLVEGGIGPQTTQVLRNIETVLAACGCTLADVAKVNVYVTDMTRFPEMNEAYVAVMGDDPPARITVGCSALALGALVEMDCVAFRPEG